MNCIFCKIAEKEIPADVVFENENVIAFNDIHPAAPVHILVIPRKHITSVEDFKADDSEIISSLFFAVQEIVEKKGMIESGYRLIINNGKAAGQEVFHFHLHILGGHDTLGPMLCR